MMLDEFVESSIGPDGGMRHGHDGGGRQRIEQSPRLGQRWIVVSLIVNNRRRYRRLQINVKEKRNK